jgi:hypothetical protein
VSFSMPLSVSNLKIVDEDGKAKRHKQRGRSSKTAPAVDGERKA